MWRQQVSDNTVIIQYNSTTPYQEKLQLVQWLLEPASKNWISIDCHVKMINSRTCLQPSKCSERDKCLYSWFPSTTVPRVLGTKGLKFSIEGVPCWVAGEWAYPYFKLSCICVLPPHTALLWLFFWLTRSWSQPGLGQQLMLVSVEFMFQHLSWLGFNFLASTLQGTK